MLGSTLLADRGLACGAGFFASRDGRCRTAGVAGDSRGATYPTRPVHIIVGFAAGGGVDITARLIGHWLSEWLGQSVVIENRPGADGNIGTEFVVNASADGYTLLLATVPNAVNAALKLNFNFIRDIAPVAGIIRVPMVVLVHPTVPASTIAEFISYAKANPGKVNMASAGTGSAPHMAGELFKRWPASTWFMFRIGAKVRRLLTCLAVRCKCCLQPRPEPPTTSGPASCSAVEA